MIWREETLRFDCTGEQLLGIVARPEAPRDVGVVVIVGGPQYRAGSHRQFVSLARRLAGSGYAALRFDHRGMGDSAGAQRNFEQISADIEAAINALMQAVAGLRRVALWGLCDGASAALLYMQERRDARVSGLCLLNPWVRSEASLAKVHVKHYYRQRLMERGFWAKLIRGGVGTGALNDLWRNLRSATASAATGVTQAGATPYQQRMAQAWVEFEGSTLLVMSERDLTAAEFDAFTQSDAAWRRALQRRPPKRVNLADADHTCSTPSTQRAAEDATLEWLQRSVAGLP